MENSIPIVDGDFLLQKMPGKGGWTFVLLPDLQQNKRSWFGMTKVCGNIDTFEISNYNLMPFGNGNLFLPVKSEIRKNIGKSEGDWVHLVLYSQDLPPVETEDFFTCLAEEPLAYDRFNKLSKPEQKKLIDWIYSVRNDSLRVERIAQTIDKLLL
jgi:hypothetical protein